MFQDMRIYTRDYQNGFTLSEMGAILTSESSMDLFPQRDLHTTTIVGRPGSLKTNSVIRPRNINPVIHFTTEDLPTNNRFKGYTIDELDSFLTSLFINDYEDYYIEFTDLSGKFYPVVWDSAKAPRILLADGIVSYNLICYDPYVYGDVIQRLVTGSSVTLHQQYGTESVFPTIRCKANEPGLFTLIVNGVSTDYTLNPSYSAQNTGYIYLDTYKRTMINDAGTNLLNHYAGGFPEFPSGSSVSASIGTGTTEVLFSYRSRSLY